MSPRTTPARIRPAWRWVEELTAVPTAPGREQRVVAWVRRWAARRSDVAVATDQPGNLLLTLGPGGERPPLVVVSHLDHPGFVVEEVRGRSVIAAFRGGVAAERFAGAPVELVDSGDGVHAGTVVERTGDRAAIALRRSAPGLRPGDVGRWRFPARALGVRDGLLRAPACDDLAGAAACLAALDAARRHPSRRHLVVLLTRAEEIGFVGAIGAIRSNTLPEGARVISVETSKASAEAPVGGGPILRVGDAATVFDGSLTNSVSELLREEGIEHRRRLMIGGTCEASVFVAAGVPATGLCLPLGNYHNMADSDPLGIAPEIISFADFDGLIRMIGAVAGGLDEPRDGGFSHRLDRLYREGAHVLE